MCSSPGQELLGVITSHGPSRESYTTVQKSSGRPAEAPAMLAAVATVSAQRLRAALPSATIAPEVLQRVLPGAGAEVVAVEGTTEVPDFSPR